MKKLKCILLAGIMMISAIVLPKECVKADSVELNANQWYEQCLVGGTKQEYVYTMPASGYVTFNVVDEYYTTDGVMSSSTSWWMPTKIVVNDKLYVDTNVYAYNGEWTSPMLSFKKGTKIKIIFSSTSSTAKQWFYKFRVKTTSVKNFETENNNSKSKADKVKLNTTYTGIMMLDDVDYYVFTAPSKGKYKFLAVNTDVDNYYSLSAVLYNSSYKSLANTGLASGAGWKNMSTVSLKKGQKVYMKFSSYNKNFKYKLKVKKA